MKKGYTHIAIVLDDSGSMQIIKNDTIGGFNAFIKKHKEVTGADSKCTLSLATFNEMNRGYSYQIIGNPYNEAKHLMTLKSDFVDISSVQELNDSNYTPNKMTPLYDAIGSLINDVGSKLRALKEEDRPEKVLFMIITDGEENNSSLFNSESVRNKIKHQTDTYNWEFMFLGANHDSILAAGKIGISATRAANYSSHKVGETYTTLLNKTADFRGLCGAAASASLNFTAQDRAQMSEDVQQSGVSN